MKPEDIWQLGFYVQTVNEQLKHPSDGDAIGLLICKRKKRLVAEYALKSSGQLLGVSEYKLTKLLPQDFKSSLPSVKDIEAQLAEKGHVGQKHKKRSKVRHAKHATDAERRIAGAKKGQVK